MLILEGIRYVTCLASTLRYPAKQRVVSDLSLGTHRLGGQGEWCSHKPSEKNGDVMAWKSFLHNWPFERGIHRWPVDSPHKGSVMQSFWIIICVSRTKLLNKQSSCQWQWFETPYFNSSRTSDRHISLNYAINRSDIGLASAQRQIIILVNTT